MNHYVERKVAEALKAARGSRMGAMKRLAKEASDDPKLMMGLMKPHLEGVLGYAIDKVKKKHNMHGVPDQQAMDRAANQPEPSLGADETRKVLDQLRQKVSGGGAGPRAAGQSGAGQSVAGQSGAARGGQSRQAAGVRSALGQGSANAAPAAGASATAEAEGPTRKPQRRGPPPPPQRGGEVGLAAVLADVKRQSGQAGGGEGADRAHQKSLQTLAKAYQKKTSASSSGEG